MTHRRLVWLGVAVTIVLSAWLWLRDANPSTKDIQKMSTYTEKMTTHCVGRFLIDVPQKATVSEGSYELQIASLKTKKTASLPQQTLLSNLASELTQRQEVLSIPRTAYNDSTKFHATYQPSANTRSIRYTTKSGDAVMDGYVVMDTRVFELHTNANDENDVQEFNNFLIEIAPTLRAREASEIPTTPGACFNGGLTSMNPKRGENVSWSWDLEGHPDVSFGVSMSTNDDKVGPGILDREATIMAVLGGAAGQIKNLRKRRIEIGGMKAQEWSRAPQGKKPEYNLELEIPGLPNSNAAPAITLSLTVGGSGKDGYVAPSLSEGEALALWDAVVQTLRLRPGAI
jgi:hypothetical protein